MSWSIHQIRSPAARSIAALRAAAGPRLAPRRRFRRPGGPPGYAPDCRPWSRYRRPSLHERHGLYLERLDAADGFLTAIVIDDHAGDRWRAIRSRPTAWGSSPGSPLLLGDPLCSAARLVRNVVTGCEADRRWLRAFDWLFSIDSGKLGLVALTSSSALALGY
jgi:hypothetical protein